MQARTPVQAGEPANAVPEADPEGGHRGSRARLVRRPIATTAVLAGVLAVAGGAVGLTRLTARPADVPRPVAKSAPAPHGIFAAPPQAHSGKRVPRPVDLIIPAIRVRTALETLGRTPQGTLQVPDSTTIAGWYTGSPRPGEIGSSIIAGHIDSTPGPGVFFRLRLLRPGNLVYVRRAGGTLAVFRVTGEHMYAKERLPDRAGLRAGPRRRTAPHHVRRRVRPSDRLLPEQRGRLRHPGQRAPAAAPSPRPAARSPSPGAPLLNVRALGAQRGVLAVARVHPGAVGQRAEHPFLQVVHELAEPLRVLLGVAGPAGEQ